MRVTIRLFARLREIAGADELERELPEFATARDAWTALAREFPDLAAHGGTISCAVNESYARLTTPLHDGDVVAFLPPVSGGAGSGIRDAGSGMRDAESGMRNPGCGIDQRVI